MCIIGGQVKEESLWEPRLPHDPESFPPRRWRTGASDESPVGGLALRA